MEYQNIYEYILRSKEHRQRHLCLDEACICIGGRSDGFRGLLAHYLGTTIPKGKTIHLCHACNNGKCSNSRHLYWGTNKENIDDSEFWKFGIEAARKVNTGRRKSESHKQKLSAANKGKPSNN